MAAELVILVGLQASGKSTFFRERFAATHKHVSKDLFRNNRNRNRRQRELVEAALLAGCPVVVDNTNPTVEERRALIELGRQFGARIVGYAFESGMRERLTRNARRERKARVPDVAIYATAKRLVPPPARRASTSFCAYG
jgi:predicted kinase